MRHRHATHTAKQLSQKVNGSLRGDPNLTLRTISSFENPQPNTLVFVREASRSSEQKLLSSELGLCILVSEAGMAAGRYDTMNECNTLISVPDPYSALLDLLPLFFEPLLPPRGIHPTAEVHPSARIGSDVSIGAHCNVGADVEIGDTTVLHSNVTLYERCHIGRGVTLHSGVVIREECIVSDRCTIHNNTVIGADGFGYVPDPNIGLLKVPQVGKVLIDSDVEIGANSCIDRGAFGDTVIGKGTKIDNLVQIGHNVTIGKGSILCGQGGVGGSVSIGDGVILAGASGIADHVSIASGVRVGGKSGVTNSLTSPGDYVGYPAIPASQWRRMIAHCNRLARRKGRGKP
jgi:UDP-3-O-[3-hydroxymyristoyl] glucosamine N-acyltransferase